jgi:hypothetical protein
MRAADQVEAVYLAFAAAGRPGHVAGCPCCRPLDADRALLDTPLRQLDAETLGEYMFSAITTWGSAEGFRYFVPRILDLLVNDKIDYPDIEVVLGKFPVAGWPGWPPTQRRSVEDLLHQYWIMTLGSGGRPVEVVLCALGQVFDDLTPLLGLWTAMLDGPACAAHLRGLAATVHQVRVRGRLANAFWDQRPAQQRQVIDWLCSVELETAVEAAFFRAGDTDAAAVLSEIHQYLSVPR